jgi:RNA polymerase sigma-70 factor (ECF subfamily)
MDGDRERFERMFRSHYADVVRYAVRRVGQDAAQEVVAETFLVAWRRLDDVPEHALPWLYATARRVVANELRRRHRAERLDDRVAARGRSSAADLADIVADQVRVQAALDGLLERDREVLRLTAWERLTVAEAAQALGCSVAACKVRLHRARRRLAALLGAADPAAETLVPQGDIP